MIRIRKYSFIIILLLVIGCANRSRTSQVVSQSVEAEQDSLLLDFADTLFEDSLYSGPFEISRFFGYFPASIMGAECCSVPQITGMTFVSDSIHNIGLRCPSERGVLQWCSGRLKRFDDWCLTGIIDSVTVDPPLLKNPASQKDIVKYYFNRIHIHLPWNNDALEQFVREQFGVMLVDVWKSYGLCTMQEATWYDFGSCGDNTTRSWFTIDVRTGKSLTVDDIIEKSGRQKFARLVIRHLTNGDGPWFDYARGFRECDLIDFLNSSSGIALVEVGIVVFYHPYVIGCGAEGQYNALIPYDEVKSLLTDDLRKRLSI